MKMFRRTIKWKCLKGGNKGCKERALGIAKIKEDLKELIFLDLFEVKNGVFKN